MADLLSQDGRVAFVTGAARGIGAAGGASAQEAAAPAANDEKSLKKSCDKGATADCYTLAGMYRTGQGAAKDIGKASGLFKKACEGEDGPGAQ